MAENGAWVFIEEPEINMHPGMLRLFIQTILTNEEIVKKDLRFFFTSHSSHLLSFVYERPDDISLFSFRPINSEQSNITHIDKANIEVLDDLGVYNSSLFMANCSIWVEGPSDRAYLRGFLKAYEKHLQEEQEEFTLLQEDLHYCFFQFGGSSFAHYFFDEHQDSDYDGIEKIKASFLSNRIILLHDQDLLGQKAAGNKKFTKNLRNGQKATPTSPI